MKSARGLKVRIEECKGLPRIASAKYQAGDPDHVIVTLEPSSTPRGATFVRTASIHFDIDPNGDLSVLEILGPPRSKWKKSDLRLPEKVMRARIRFNEPEQCEEEGNEVFETNEQEDLLHIILNLNTSTRYVEPAAGLVFGIDKEDQLVEIWILNLRSFIG